MRKVYLPLLIFFTPLLFYPLIAQDFTDFKPLQSSGQIPNDFLQLSSQQYEHDKASIAKGEKAFDKKTKRRFYLENSFIVRELLYSGKVLFNDPVSLYVNRVADQLLKHDPAKRQQLRIYVVKSSSVNAFATNSGMIFINLGLISQLESESQLAFVLAHEFTHYFNKHVVNKYVENKKVVKGKTVYRSLSLDEKLLTRSNYSKELETEADLEGLEMFLKSNYSTSQLKGVFDVLQYAYLPYDDVPFEKTFLESKHLLFPASYFLTKVKDISPPEQEDDAKSTHPSIDKRRNYILEKIGGKEGSGKKDYLVSEEEFVKMRKTARFEIASLYLSNLQYEKAIYHSYLLLREEPGCRYLEKIIAKSLYGLSKYSNEGELSMVHGDYEKVEGQSQQVYHLFEKLKSKELNAVALKYVWNLKRKYSSDTELSGLADDLLRSLVLKHCESKLDFATQAAVDTAQPMVAFVSTDTTATQRMNKYAKIDQAQMPEKLSWENHFIKYAFVDDFQDQEFGTTFDQYWQEKEKASQKPKETKKQERARLKKERQAKALEESKLKRKGASLGIDKVVMVNPSFMEVDQRKKKGINYLDSESGELNLNERIMQNARRAGLQVELLGDYSFTAADVQKFNDYAFMKSWINERLNHLEAEVPMNNFYTEQVQALIQKYGTKYYCWTGLIDVRERKGDATLVLVSTIIVLPFLPYGIYYVVTPKYHTYYYSLVFDITTGKPVFTDFQFINKKQTQDVVNSIMYNTFYQVKKKK